MYGDDGDDLLNGGVGSNVLDGGSGNDTVNYNFVISEILVNLNDGVATTNISKDLLRSIETVYTSWLNDIVYLNQSDNNAVFTREGDDKIYG